MSSTRLQSVRAPAAGLRTRDFDRVYQAPARRQRSRRFRLLARPNQAGHTRWGFSVKAALGGAVVRNRIKRRLRVLVREAEPALPRGLPASPAGGEAGRQGWDIVLQPLTREVATARFQALRQELAQLFAEALRKKTSS